MQSPSNNHDQVPNNINGHINVISKSPQHDKDDSGMLDTGFNSSSEQVKNKFICKIFIEQFIDEFIYRMIIIQHLHHRSL